MEDRIPRILVVESDTDVLRDVPVWLTRAGYSAVTASDASETRTLLGTDTFDLVVTELNMPGLPALDLLAFLQAKGSGSAFLIMTSEADRDAATEALEAGADGHLLKPFRERDLLIHVARGLERRQLKQLAEKWQAGEDAGADAPQERQLRREEEIVFRLLGAIGRRSDETEEHVRRVGLYSSLLARNIGWDERATEEIRLAAPMHDLGEIGIPDGIIVKPGALSVEEFALMKKHTEIGASVLEGSDSSLLQMAKDIALCHHEKWDGTGYPAGLSGEAIPEAARIVAIADVYDALLSERVYRLPLSEDEALSIMLANRGKYFDPRIFDSFLRLLPEFRAIRGIVQDEEDLSIDFGDLA